MRETKFRVPAWFGLFGLLGFLGFLPANNGYYPYFFFAFFGFFGWFFWARLQREKVDERLLENQKRAGRVMLGYYMLLSLALLFLLDKGLSGELTLLFGSLAYGLGFILSPALILFFDRVNG